MVQVNVLEAKTHLSQLLKRAQDGEEVIIARDGTPVAQLVPIEAKRTPRTFGSMRGLIHVPDDFDDPMPDFEADFYGDDE